MIRQGKLSAAAEILQDALKTYAPGGQYVVPEVSGLAVNLGNIWVEQNKLDQAEALLQQGLEWAHLTAQSAIKRGAWSWLMYIRRLRGDWEGAYAAWTELAAVMSLQPEYNRALAIELDAYRAAVDPQAVRDLARQVAEWPLELELDQAAHRQLPSYGL